MTAKIVAVDRSRRNKEFHERYFDIKHSLIENFGVGTLNRSLDAFAWFAGSATTAHPKSAPAEIAIRLSYFVAALVALSLDFIGSEISFRAADERLKSLTNAIRYGNADEGAGLERIRVAVALIEKYAPSGEGAARAVDFGVKKELESIPAEIIAEHVVKSTKPEELFQIARRLEHLAFQHIVPPFDLLSFEEKSFVAVLLDYSGFNRAKFASSWGDGERERSSDPRKGQPQPEAGPLFSEKSGN
jgi:hypothetical protein